MENKCSGTCQDKQQTCIPFFVAENQVMHMDATNKRMLIALLTVCVTFILTILLWMTGELTHLDSNVVAMIPFGIFVLTGIFKLEMMVKSKLRRTFGLFSQKLM